MWVGHSHAKKLQENEETRHDVTPRVTEAKAFSNAIEVCVQCGKLADKPAYCSYQLAEDPSNCIEQCTRKGGGDAVAHSQPTCRKHYQNAGQHDYRRHQTIHNLDGVASQYGEQVVNDAVQHGKQNEHWLSLEHDLLQQIGLRLISIL